MPLTYFVLYHTTVSDLTPITGMPLTHLSCSDTKVTDLSPIRGMKLATFHCDFKPERDAALLRSIKTLETINKLPAAEFWKKVDAELVAKPATNVVTAAVPAANTVASAPAAIPPSSEDAFFKSVAGLPAEQKVARVVAKLKELNPNFDGKETHKIESGAVTELSISTVGVTDITPVRALKWLKKLVVTPWAANQKGALSDLSALKGLPLTWLWCHNNPISDLSPLKGIPLTVLSFGGTQVGDLSPLTGMKLTVLSFNDTAVTELGPLEGMPLTVLWCNNTKVMDLAPLKTLPLQELRCDFVAARDAAVLRSIKTLAKINDIAAGAFWMRVGPIAGRLPSAGATAATTPRSTVVPATRTEPLPVKEQIEGLPFTKVASDGKLNVSFVGGYSIPFTTKDPLPIGVDGAPLKFNKRDERVYFRFDTLLASQGKTYVAWKDPVKLNAGAKYKAVFYLRQFNAEKLVLDVRDGKLLGKPQETLYFVPPSQPEGVWQRAQIVFVPQESSARFAMGIPSNHKGKCDVCDVRLESASQYDETGIIGAKSSQPTGPATTPMAAQPQGPAISAKEQIRRFVEKMKELNPEFDGKVSYKGEAWKVTELEFSAMGVTDISPITQLRGLAKLKCEGAGIHQRSKLADLSPLRGAQLTQLVCGFSQVEDLSPLKGMRLTVLSIWWTRVTDLSPLNGMPLKELSMNGVQVSDLSPLIGMPLTRMGFSDTPISDLSPLKSMPLTSLSLVKTKVSDLSQLKNMRLTVLRCYKNQVTDLSPIKGMPLEQLACDFVSDRDTKILRSMKTLVQINDLLAKEFWKRVEAGEAPQATK